MIFWDIGQKCTPQFILYKSRSKILIYQVSNSHEVPASVIFGAKIARKSGYSPGILYAQVTLVQQIIILSMVQQFTPETNDNEIVSHQSDQKAMKSLLSLSRITTEKMYF